MRGLPRQLLATLLGVLLALTQAAFSAHVHADAHGADAHEQCLVCQLSTTGSIGVDSDPIVKLPEPALPEPISAAPQINFFSAELRSSALARAPPR